MFWHRFYMHLLSNFKDIFYDFIENLFAARHYIGSCASSSLSYICILIYIFLPSLAQLGHNFLQPGQHFVKASSFKLRQPNIYVMLPGMPVSIQRLPPQGKGGTMQEFRIVVSAFHKL